jgi:hypothetical protein
MRDHAELFERLMRPADRLTMVGRVLTALWLAVCLIELGVWTMICVIGGEFQSPWWLWTVGVGGAVVGGFWLVTNRPGTKR